MPAICGHTLANLTVLTFLSSPTLSQKCIYYVFVDIVVMYIKTVGQMVKDIIIFIPSYVLHSIWDFPGSIPLF